MEEVQEEPWHPDAPLQADSAARKLWLVKVGVFRPWARRPPCSPSTRTTRTAPTRLPRPSHTQVPNFVAKRWKACCDQSVERGEPTGQQLATLRLVAAADEAGGGAPPKTQYHLQLTGTLCWCSKQQQCGSSGSSSSSLMSSSEQLGCLCVLAAIRSLRLLLCRRCGGAGHPTGLCDEEHHQVCRPHAGLL